jgi:hypothetical protein
MFEFAVKVAHNSFYEFLNLYAAHARTAYPSYLSFCPVCFLAHIYLQLIKN